MTSSTRLLLASAGVGWFAIVIAKCVDERWSWVFVGLAGALLAGFLIQSWRGK